MKKDRIVIVIIAITVLLAGCSTTERGGLSISDVTDTGCDGVTRADVVPNSPRLKMTKTGSTIGCELTKFGVPCSARNIIVSCEDSQQLLDIKVRGERQSDADDVINNCMCPTTVYFTIRDTEGDNFYVNLNGESLGGVSFSSHSIVEIDLDTKQHAYEDGFDYPFKLVGAYINTVSEEVMGGRTLNGYLDISINKDTRQLAVRYEDCYFPFKASKMDLNVETEEDGTLVMTPIIAVEDSIDCWGQMSWTFQNAMQDSYRLKVNPHKKSVVGADGTVCDTIVCDYEGEVSVDHPVHVDLWDNAILFY